jgi:hypothetical protein
MARAIQPFASVSDGDTLYAVTTGEIDNPKLSSINLGLLASEVAWDAVLASVPPLPSIGSSDPFALSDKDVELAHTSSIKGSARSYIEMPTRWKCRSVSTRAYISPLGSPSN